MTRMRALVVAAVLSLTACSALHGGGNDTMLGPGETAQSVQTTLQGLVDQIRDGIPAEGGWRQTGEGGKVSDCSTDIPRESRSTSSWASAGEVDHDRIPEVLDEVLAGTGMEWSLSGDPDDGLYLAGRADGRSIQVLLDRGTTMIAGFTGCLPTSENL